MAKTSGGLFFFIAAAFLFLWIDLFLGHTSQGLHHPAMWLPLVFLPCAIVISLIRTITDSVFLRRLFQLFSLGAFIVGLLGFGFHFARLWRDLNGPIQWDVLIRLMRYPPLLAPLAVSGVGILGLLINKQFENDNVKENPNGT